MSKIIGKRVTFNSLTPDEARIWMERKGVPQWAIQTMRIIAEWQRNGKGTSANDTVQEILNKPPRAVEHFVKVKDYIEFFK